MKKKLIILIVFLVPLIAFAEIRTCIRIDCPESPHLDEELEIKVEGLAPEDALTIEASFIDDHQLKWSSRATYLANDQGIINLSELAPISGSYDGIDSMGLFWSMQREDGRSGFPSIRRNYILFDLKAFDGDRQVGGTQIKRVILAENIERIEVDDNGLRGVLFLPEKQEYDSTVIFLAGSSGGVHEKRASLLASHGIPTLALAYFGAEGLPEHLENVSLEYFQTAFEWIKKHPRLSDTISLYGYSRGAELSLLLGSVFPDEFNAIAAVVPSSFVFGGLHNPTNPAWIYQGEPVLPIAPISGLSYFEMRGFFQSYPLATSDLFTKGMIDYEAWEPAAIPVEKIKARLLIVSGSDDQMWPSSLFCKQIMERLHESNRICKHLEYPNAGHGIALPYLPGCTVYYHPIFKRWFSLGGTRLGTDLASRDAWKEIIEFFR